MMSLTAALLFVALSVPSLCQIHLGPQGTAKPPTTCYNCEGHGHNVFPDCLNHVHNCHGDEVCAVTYGNGRPTIHCQKSDDCTRETSHPMRNCTGGGVEVHNNECKKCCKDAQCTGDLVDLLKLEFGESKNLLCPGDCMENNIAECINKAHHCHHGQFCQVSKEHGEVWGECKDDHEYHHCSEELSKHPCGHAVGHHHGPAEHGRCFWDCCTTNDCLYNHFGAYMTTQPPVTTTAATVATTATAAPGSGLWDKVHGQCADQLENNGCQTLAQTKNICHDRVTLAVCPKTCGLCDAVNSAACHDTVINDGCKDLVASEDVCSKDIAVFICPQTCNKCDELVNSVITSLVDGNSTATDVPATLLPPSADPSNFPTFDCNDIKGESCGVLDSLCSTSFVKVVCPQVCDTCTDPIQTATVGMVVDLASTTPATQAPPASTMAPPASTMAPPASTMAPPASTMAPPASTMAPAASTGMPAGNVTAGALCVDNLNGLGCNDLADVCNSVLALSVCPKFCGLC